MIAPACCLAALAVGQVELRALEPAPTGEVAQIDARGVLVKPADGAGVVISWDRVKSVGGAREADAAAFRGLADTAWRARTRLERGDAIAAEPLFETAFREVEGRPGPTAAVIAEGLLRCRLRRGAHMLAAEAWLSLLESGDTTPGSLHPRWAEEAGLSPVLDPATRLIPAIPPIWCGPGAARVLAGLPGFERSGPSPSGVVASLAALYAQAARFEAGEPATVPDEPQTDPGVALVRQVVTARIGNAAQRQQARGALESRLPTGGAPEGGSALAPWIEAWCRVAIGRSLLREESRETRQLGVIELLVVPARLSEVHPYLTGVALAEASVALADLGDPEGAGVLLDELRDRYPDHPVLEWNPIRLQPPRPPRPVATRAGTSADDPRAK